jgi:hypothetical protein
MSTAEPLVSLPEGSDCSVATGRSRRSDHPVLVKQRSLVTGHSRTQNKGDRSGGAREALRPRRCGAIEGAVTSSTVVAESVGFMSTAEPLVSLPEGSDCSVATGRSRRSDHPVLVKQRSLVTGHSRTQNKGDRSGSADVEVCASRPERREDHTGRLYSCRGRV